MSDRLEVLPGPGTVLRHGHLAVWAGLTCSPALLSFLIQSARNVGESNRSGLQIVDHISGILASRDPEPGAPFAVVGPANDSWVTLLHGPVQLWDGARWLAPTPQPGWLRSEVRPQPAISIGPAGGASPRLSPDSPYDLRDGIVPGGGLVLVPDRNSPPPPYSGASTRVAPAPTGPTTPTGPAAPTGPVATTGPASTGPAAPTVTGAPGGFPGGPPPPADDVGTGASIAVGATPRKPETDRQPEADRRGGGPVGSGPVVAPDGAPVAPVTAPPGASRWLDLHSVSAATRPAVPIGGASTPAGRPDVAGVRCVRGHFNHPATQVCGWCGQAVTAGQPLIVGPRPVLGVLLAADDGTTFLVDVDQVLGRDPTTDQSVADGRLRAVVLTGAPGQMAPAHAELRLHEWTVSVIDRGSAAGTFVVPAGTVGWTRLTPYRPQVISPGSHVSIGQRVLTFLSPWPG